MYLQPEHQIRNFRNILLFKFPENLFTRQRELVNYIKENILRPSPRIYHHNPKPNKNHHTTISITPLELISFLFSTLLWLLRYFCEQRYLNNHNKGCVSFGQILTAKSGCFQFEVIFILRLSSFFMLSSILRSSLFWSCLHFRGHLYFWDPLLKR